MGNRGFTLIELVVVIVLLGILSAIVLPKFLDVASDARRSANNDVVASLNTAVAKAISGARIPGYLARGAGVPATRSATTTPYVITLDPPNSALYNFITFYSNTTLIPIGGAKQAGTISGKTITPTNFAGASTGGTAYMDMTTPGGGNIPQACTNLFNSLLGDNSVQTAVLGTTTTSYQTFSNTPGFWAPTYINGQDATTFYINGAIINGFTSILIPMTVGTSPSGVCLYFMNSSSSSAIKFYIVYDASKGVFYPVEAPT